MYKSGMGIFETFSFRKGASIGDVQTEMGINSSIAFFVLISSISVIVSLSIVAGILILSINIYYFIAGTYHSNNILWILVVGMLFNV